ncbi:probable dipeptidyl-aminopeptidase B isoform X4 [Acropora millepora]|uniref:probable dipeptidyl-aminopeptidase B isoform X4 n=1 Tax=Acropora millepora TaxID=45264 RepID=UPI001CF47B51|nr:probable dipeptidyl-aminopeptidase B isoform X4 [Acropora millepora]
MIPIEYNEDLRERLAELSRPKVEQYTVRAGSYDLHVKEYRPPNFDVSKKYAVLFSVYGGPGSQKVTDTYGYGFESGYLVSNFDLVVVNLDARGTCCRGERFKHAVYKQIGKAEAEDTIAVAKYVASKPYVDENKIAIWGWIQFTQNDTCSLHRKIMKDMRYRQCYLWLTISRMKVSLLYMAQGMNTAQLVAALTKAGVKYQVQFYTDKNHGILGKQTERHLFQLLTDFLTKKLRI